MQIRASFAHFSTALVFMAASLAAQTHDLPTSKELIEPVPGHPQRLNSLPMSMAVLDTTSGTVADFPDDRTLARRAHQTLYSGLAFSRDGTHLYASMGSVTDPLGQEKDDAGSGI